MEISWEKFQKIRKLLNFRKVNHSTESSGNSGMKVKWNRNFLDIIFKNLDIPHEVVLFSEFRIFYSGQASSFGRNHSKLDISCKDDVHSVKETL